MPYIDITCPECDSEIEDIEVEVTGSTMREEYWGRPVSWSELEVEVPTVKCPECGHDCTAEAQDKAHDTDWSDYYA